MNVLILRLRTRCDPTPDQSFHDRRVAGELPGLPNDGKLIVSVGNQENRKWTDLLLRAFKKLDQSSNCHLLLMGKFDDETEKIAGQVSSQLKATA